MNIGPVKGTKGEGKKGKKGKGKDKKVNSEPKGNTWTDDSYFVGECGYCVEWEQKKAQFQKQKKDQGSKLQATVNQVHSSDGSEDLFLDIRRECTEWTKRTNLG